MTVQTISSDQWEVGLPESWIDREAGANGSLYFEAPNQTEGVYLSTWQTRDQPLRSAMLDTREIERRNLPDVDGEWELLKSLEEEDHSHVEVFTEYFNPTAQYRIVSRLLGRADYYVRFTYHDYDCGDVRASTERSDPWIQSLALRDQDLR